MRLERETHLASELQRRIPGSVGSGGDAVESLLEGRVVHDKQVRQTVLFSMRGEHPPEADTLTGHDLGASFRLDLGDIDQGLTPGPFLLDRLRGRVAPPAQVHEPPAASTPVEPLRTRLARGLGRLWSWVGSGLRTVGQAGVHTLRRVRERARAAWTRLQAVRRFRTQFLTALTIGVVLGVAAYCAAPWLAAAASGLGGFATTVLVQIGLWLRRMRGAGLLGAT